MNSDFRTESGAATMPRGGEQVQEPLCPLCTRPSVSVLYHRPDFEFGVATQLQYHCCQVCGLVFADPIPREKIASFYASYSTHGQLMRGERSRLAQLSRNMALREFASIGVATTARLLDYGCGDGSFLLDLRQQGYANIIGYDFDPQARVAARGFGFNIADEEPSGPFDAITMNHVIEHLVDPVEDLKRLAGMLAPGGLLIVRTPNGASLLARTLGSAWRGWETPRHLHVFTPAAVQALIAKLPGLTLQKRFTSEAMYLGIFHESLRHRFWKTQGGKALRHGVALSSFAALVCANAVMPLGEELVFVFRRS